MDITGVKIYSNSFSEHVKREYHTLLSFGVPDGEAEEAVLEHYRNFRSGLYAGPFWLGLAQAEADVGRVSERVRQGALCAMESDLMLWHLAVELENDYKERRRRDYLARKWVTSLRESHQENIKGAVELEDAIARAQARSSAHFFEEGLKILRARAAATPAAERKPVAPPPHHDGWRPDSRLPQDWKRPEGFGYADDSTCVEIPYSDEDIQPILLYSVLGLGGSAAKKLTRREAEHAALRAQMDKPQLPKVVSKPYFHPSPWLEGDVFSFHLRDLTGELSSYNDLYAACRIIEVWGWPISAVRPDLGMDENQSVGLYGWGGKAAPTMTELDQTPYIPFDSFMGVSDHGLWLNLYGAKRELKKWEWQVIGNTPDFSKHLPDFFEHGALASCLVGFGDALAYRIAEALRANEILPPNE